MNNLVPPAAIFILAAFILPFLNGRIKQIFVLITPVIAFISVLTMTAGNHFIVNFLDYKLILVRVDKLSMAFGFVFTIAALIGMVFALHLKERAQHVAAFLYAGSALGVIFAGDYLTLFFFWEVMAVASTYLIWATRSIAAQRAGFKYLLMHLFGGLLLLTGILLYVNKTGLIGFNYLGLKDTYSYLILLGFALNAAIPPLSAWLSDAYPEATITGVVFLSAFTTKTAVYVLARAFPGAEVLMWAGAIMAFYGVFFATLANDIRRILAYHIISQVGFMVAGIGIGTTLAINGAVAHAFVQIVCKGLLFMGSGTVLYATGKSKLSELGGLYKSMPAAFYLYMIGALSISAFPLFSAFVSKSMIVSAAGKEHLLFVWVILTICSAGTFLSTGLKLPYFTWFGKDANLEVKKTPVNMLIAMGLASAVSIIIGVYPASLYNLLPFEVEYVPYTAEHVVSSLQFLFFTGLGFILLKNHLAGEPYIVLDTDWFYRKGARGFLWFINNPMATVGQWTNKLAFERIPSAVIWFGKNPTAAMRMAGDMMLLPVSGKTRKADLRKRIARGKDIYPGDIIKHWPIGSTVLWITMFLLAYLVIYYLSNNITTPV